MPGGPWKEIVLVFLVVWPLLGFLRDLRYRVFWVREAEGAKETLRRFLRSTGAVLLHLVALGLYFLLIWWILSQPLSEMR